MLLGFMLGLCLTLLLHNSYQVARAQVVSLTFCTVSLPIGERLTSKLFYPTINSALSSSTLLVTLSALANVVNRSRDAD